MMNFCVGDSDGDGPQPVGHALASDDDFVLFDNTNFVLVKYGNAIIVTELGQGYECPSL